LGRRPAAVIRPREPDRHPPKASPRSAAPRTAAETARPNRPAGGWRQEIPPCPARRRPPCFLCSEGIENGVSTASPGCFTTKNLKKFPRIFRRLEADGANRQDDLSVGTSATKGNRPIDCGRRCSCVKGSVDDRLPGDKSTTQRGRAQRRS
jgi:hypothetical protein